MASTTDIRKDQWKEVDTTRKCSPVGKRKKEWKIEKRETTVDEEGFPILKLWLSDDTHAERRYGTASTDRKSVV